MSGWSRTGTAPDDRIRAFRTQLHWCFGRRADALFELTDSILSAGRVPSAVHLCLATVHRRSWGSPYAALSKGRIDAEALRELLVSHGPGRVLRSFVTLLPLVGTPAAAPKPRGRSPGRPRGSRSGRAKRYPVVKKVA